MIEGMSAIVHVIFVSNERAVNAGVGLGEMGLR